MIIIAQPLQISWFNCTRDRVNCCVIMRLFRYVDALKIQLAARNSNQSGHMDDPRYQKPNKKQFAYSPWLLCDVKSSAVCKFCVYVFCALAHLYIFGLHECSLISYTHSATNSLSAWMMKKMYSHNYASRLISILTWFRRNYIHDTIRRLQSAFHWPTAAATVTTLFIQRC